MTLEVKTSRVYTAQGVPLTVVGVAQVKINGADEEMHSYAAEQFGGEIIPVIDNLVIGLLRQGCARDSAGVCPHHGGSSESCHGADDSRGDLQGQEDICHQRV